MLKVQLRTEKQIKAKIVTVEEDGATLAHTDGVLHKQSVIDTLRGMDELVIAKIHKYGDKYAIGIVKPDGVTTFISPLWLKDLTDGTITVTTPLSASDERMKVYVEPFKDTLLHIDKLTLTKREDLKVCISCASPIEEDETLEKVKLCKRCYEEKFFVKHSYSHKPKAKFTGTQIKADIENPVWFGIELEYGIHSKLSLAKVVADENIYLKGDSSISGGDEGGAEMVTHPHSFTELMKEGSWVDKIAGIDCNSSDSNGCHVHVSRTAWKDDKHYALTYYLMYEMAKGGMLETLGGREFTNYCMLKKPTERIHKLTKEGGKGSSDRSLWLNERNDATIEFRFFGGTNDPETVRRYVQLLEAVIKYTKYHAKTVTVNGLRKYVEKHANKFQALADFVVSTDGMLEGTISVTYRLPKAKVFTADKLPYGNVRDIVSITDTKGKTFNKLSRIAVDSDYIYFTAKGRSESILFDKVASVEIEV